MSRSNFFDQLGFIDIEFLVIAIGVLLIISLLFLILLIVQMVKVSKLKKRMNQFMLGKDASSLEEDISKLYEDNKVLKEAADKSKKDIRVLYKKIEASYQRMGLVRYDAYNQMGGQLSFSLALLDQNNNGFILNSVHSTEGCYSYTKEIKCGESSISLGTEEAEALAIAMGV